MPLTIFTFTGGIRQPAKYPGLAASQPVVLPGGVSLTHGTVLGLVTGTGTAVNDVQTLTVTGAPTGGSLTLIFNGQYFSVPWNATAAAIQTAVQALSNVGAGNCTVSGGPLPGSPLVFTFTGALGGRKVPLIAIVGNQLTGGTAPAAALAETTAGVPAGGYWDAYNDGSPVTGLTTARAILREDAVTNEDGSLKTLSGDQGVSDLAASAFINGDFLGSDLIGLDTAAPADFGGRLIGGKPNALTDPTTLIHIP